MSNKIDKHKNILQILISDRRVVSFLYNRKINSNGRVVNHTPQQLRLAYHDIEGYKVL